MLFRPSALVGLFVLASATAQCVVNRNITSPVGGQVTCDSGCECTFIFSALASDNVLINVNGGSNATLQCTTHNSCGGNLTINSWGNTTMSCAVASSCVETKLAGNVNVDCVGGSCQSLSCNDTPQSYCQHNNNLCTLNDGGDGDVDGDGGSRVTLHNCSTATDADQSSCSGLHGSCGGVGGDSNSNTHRKVEGRKPSAGEHAGVAVAVAAVALFVLVFALFAFGARSGKRRRNKRKLARGDEIVFNPTTSEEMNETFLMDAMDE